MAADAAASRLKANVARLLGGSALSQLILFAATPVLTRLYGPDVFGIFAVYGGLHAVVSGIFTLKFDLAIVMPPDHPTARRLTFTTMGLSLGFSALTALILIVGSGLTGSLPPPHWVALPCGAVTAAALTCSQQWSARATSYGDFANGQIVGAVVNVVVASAVGVASGGAVHGLLAGFVLGQAASVSWFLLRTRPTWQRPHLSELVETARAWRMFPLHVLPSRIVLTLGASLLPLVGERLYSLDDVGLYALANRLLLAPSALIGGAISEAFRAEIVQRIRRGERCEAFALGLLLRAAGVAAVLVTGVALVAPLLFDTVFGARFAAAGGLLAGLAPLAFVGFVMLPLNHVLIAAGRTRLELAVQTIANALPVGALLLAWWLGLTFADAMWLVSAGAVLALAGTFLVARGVLREVDARATPSGGAP